jgi:O-antigen/teichoic acid export membrane protein
MSAPSSQPQANSDLMTGLWNRLLGNAWWLFTGAAGRSVLGFAASVYLARVLGPDLFGQLGFALAVLAYFILFTDGGLQTLGTREVAAGAGSIGELAGRVLSIRAALTAFSLLLIISGASFFTTSESTARLLVIFSFALVPLAANLSWVFRGRERMRMVGFSELLQIGSYLLLLLLLVRGPVQLFLVPAAFVAGHVLAALLLWGGHLRNWGWPRVFSTTGGRLSMLRTAFPVVLTLFLHQIYFNFDTLMLGFMRSERDVGLYVATYRIILAVISLNTVLMEAVYPTFSRLFTENREALRRLLEKSLSISVILALPMGIGGTLLARPLILAIYGPEFEGSAAALRILVWSAALAFLGANYGYCLVACGRQKLLAWAAAAGALVNVALNFWLIPRHGILGACLATVVSQALILLCEGAAFRRQIARALPSAGLSLKAVVAGLAMGLTLYFFQGRVHVYAAVAGGAAVYAGSFWLLARRGIRDLFDLGR